MSGAVVDRRAALLGAAGGALAAPAPGQGAAARTVRFVPHADLSALDPITTTGYVVRNHGYMVYDTLFGTDSALRVRPQMAEGHEVSADGLLWTIRLRPGLRFHDGEPVLARDCAASVRRWGARHGLGQTLMAMTEELAAADDRTLRFRLREPAPWLVEALGTLSGPVPFMMPERLAATPHTAPIREAVGSGPFRFLPGEWVSGSRAAYARFEGYAPREEPPDGTAGGKRALLDRVEWHVIPDPATAMGALQTGQVDWYERPPNDLLPLARRNRDLVVSSFDPIGTVTLLRFNHLHPPFDRAGARRAVLAAVGQREYMAAVAGDAAPSRECKSFFPCGTPMSTGAGGAEAMPADPARAREMLREAGYAGGRVVVISPTDIPENHTLGLVSADLLRRLGMNVDFVASDWGTVLARRASTEPPERGGWNVFHTTAVGVEFMSPASHLALRGHGRAGWPGWPTDPEIERLRGEWLRAGTDAARREAAAAIERAAFASVPYVPLGQYTLPTAHRRAVSGVLPASAPVFWNVRVG